MKHIRKGREPREFVEWKRESSTASEPTYSNLAGDPKASVLKALLVEQGYVCCYCTSRVSTDDNSHIEHFRAQKHYPELDLTYRNMHASCPGEHDEQTHLHCGHAKGNDPVRGSAEEDQFLSPLNPDCESYFRYTAQGEILPTDDPHKVESARQTISILKLNETNLEAQRRRAMRAVFNATRMSSFEEIENEIKFFQNRDHLNRFAPFCTAIVYVLKWAK